MSVEIGAGNNIAVSILGSGLIQIPDFSTVVVPEELALKKIHNTRLRSKDRSGPSLGRGCAAFNGDNLVHQTIQPCDLQG